MSIPSELVGQPDLGFAEKVFLGSIKQGIGSQKLG